MSPSSKKAERLKLLLDENVDVRLSSFLKEAGFSVLLTPKGLTNGAVLELAKKESCVLLTNDKDFGVSQLPKSGSVGIVVFRLHPPSLTNLESALDKLLRRFSPEEFAGKVFLLSEEGVEVKESSFFTK